MHPVGEHGTLIYLCQKTKIYFNLALSEKKRPSLYIRTTFKNLQWGFYKNSSKILIPLSIILSTRYQKNPFFFHFIKKFFIKVCFSLLKSIFLHFKA